MTVGVQVVCVCVYVWTVENHNLYVTQFSLYRICI
jgi:hypothetical protein